VFLNLKRDRIEVLFLLKKHSRAVVIPKIAEVGFNSILKLGVNVLVAPEWLVLYFLNQHEPLV
jgi:hypothetical protein